MKTIKKWMAYFMAVLMLCSMSQVRVLAEDALPTADTPKITEFKIQGVKGTVDDQQQKINVAGLPCNTDLTSLTAEVTCDPADAIVRFDPLKPSADDGQKKLDHRLEFPPGQCYTVLMVFDRIIPRNRHKR